MQKTLLLADESMTIQRVIELSFAQEDVKVVSVSDGRRAVQWLETDTPDIVLVDVEVPQLDGYEVAAHIKQSTRTRHVPVLLLASAFDPVDRDRAAKIGCEGVLVKPFEPQQLVTRVKDLLASAEAAQNQVARSGTRDEPATVTPFPTAARASAGESGARVAASFDSPVLAPEPLEPPAKPVWELGLPSAPVSGPGLGGDVPASPAAPAAKVSLASAFSALLAAEQSHQPAPPPATAAAAPISDAAIEDAVRRVLARLPEDLVRRIVVETAERLIREEIEKIKANPE